jgi:2TM domain
MEETRTDREKYLAAKAHVEAVKGFYIHLFVFCAVMIGLFAVDFANGVSWWVQWPFLGWGLGILGHAYLVFFPQALSTSGWEERKIKETIAKM